MDAPVRERRSWFPFFRSRRTKKPPQPPIVETALEAKPRSLSKPLRHAPPIGIDLGTTFTAVCYVEKGEVKVMQNDEGNEITPSVVHFGSDILVGEEAVKKRRDAARNTIYNIKRLMGRMCDDEFVQRQKWPFEVVPGANGRAAVRVGDDVHTPEQISARILQYMRRTCVKTFSVEPVDAVITVPANFTNAQREATRNAGRLAGLNVLQIVNEPTAAAIAFSVLNQNDERTRRVLVFDLGGGTFDVSIVEIKGRETRVLASDGLSTLGGSNFDERIYDMALLELRKQDIRITGVDWTLMEACESAKVALSSRESATISHIRYGGAGFELKRDIFNELCENLFENTLTLTDKVLSDSKLDEDDIEEVLLVGGSTRIPRIRELLEEKFTKRKIRDDIEPDLAVAKGAAILAASLTKRPPATEEANLRPSNSRKSSTSSDSSESSSDDSFAFITLLDVAPFHLGLRLEDDVFKILIEKNTPIPFTSYMHCANACDNDEKLEIEILEGNDAKASNNATLAKVEIDIPPKPAGRNNVILSIDASGILSVTVIDKDTNKEVSVTFRSDRVDERIAERPRADSLSMEARREDAAMRMLLALFERALRERLAEMEEDDD